MKHQILSTCLRRSACPPHKLWEAGLRTGRPNPKQIPITKIPNEILLVIWQLKFGVRDLEFSAL
jgi:hypothetical protein